MKKNNSWFSLIVAIWLVILISILALSILEYIIPFSRNVKWIENSAWSYYRVVSAIEDALWTKNQKILWTDFSSWTISTVTWYNYTVTASWKLLPPTWKWNSEFNKDWNIISSWNPIQLEVWNNKITQLNTNDWNNTSLIIRVPDIDWSPTSWAITEAFSWSATWIGNIIQWQLSSWTWTLNASWSYIQQKDITDSNSTTNKTILLWTKNGVKLDWTPSTLASFYWSNCITKSCILKLTVINKLEWKTWLYWWILPYLEWQFSTPSPIPLRYTNIEAFWKSYGFQKQLNIRVPQNTTIDAFNFTIFQ